MRCKTMSSGLELTGYPGPSAFRHAWSQGHETPPLLEGLLSVPSGAYLVLKWCSHW